MEIDILIFLIIRNKMYIFSLTYFRLGMLFVVFLLVIIIENIHYLRIFIRHFIVLIRMIFYLLFFHKYSNNLYTFVFVVGYILDLLIRVLRVLLDMDQVLFLMGFLLRFYKDMQFICCNHEQ